MTPKASLPTLEDPPTAATLGPLRKREARFRDRRDQIRSYAPFIMKLISSSLAVLLAAVPLTMVPLAAAPVELVEQAPAKISKVGQGTILIDFGRVAFGNLELKLPDNATQPIKVHFGEAMKDGRIDRKPPGTVRYNLTTIDPKGQSTVIAAPPADARNTELVAKSGRGHPPAVLTPDEWGVVLPFRWVEIEGWPGDLKPDQITRRAAFLSTWDDEAAAFECSDDTLNRIWELCRYSIKATTFAGVYVDGDRERIPYEADAYLNQLSHYYIDYDIETARDTIDHLLLNPTWPTEWSPHMVFMVHADYMHTGDRGWMASRYQALKSKTLMQRRGKDDLVASGPEDIKRTDIVDWPKGERDGYVFTPRNTVVNAFHLQALRLMASMAREIGADKDAADYQAKFTSGLDAFQKALLDRKKGLFRDGIGTDHSSLHANLFPLAFQLVPEAREEPVAEWLAKRGMKCSVYAAQYYMEALFENGQATAALDLILADNDRSWKHMLDSGTTITWEAWGMKYKPNQDWNHAWGAAPANLLPRYVLGAQALHPGWKAASIRPHPGNLSSATGKIPTPRGPILIDWTMEDSFAMSLELPDGMQARVDLPSNRKDATVLMNGQPVDTTLIEGHLRVSSPVTGKAKFEVK